jgi:hypothetical protein
VFMNVEHTLPSYSSAGGSVSRLLYFRKGTAVRQCLAEIPITRRIFDIFCDLDGFCL